MVLASLSAMMQAAEADHAHFSQSSEPNTIPATEASLRAALAQGGLITFSESATIQLDEPLEVRTTATILGEGRIVLDGRGSNRIFHIFPGGELELRNVVLDRGADHAAGDAELEEFEPNLAALTRPAAGGAILNEGTFRLFDSVIQNSAAYGSSSLWRGSFQHQLTNKFQAARGGAIFNQAGTMVLSNVVIANCVALAAGDWSHGPSHEAAGGAIFSSGGSMDLTEVHFTKNRATQRPGNRNTPGPPPFEEEGLAARVRGGAVTCEGGTNRFRRCDFSGNEADKTAGAALFFPDRDAAGGALVNEGGTMIVEQSTFVSNTVAGAFSVQFSPGQPSDGQTAKGGAIFNRGELEVRESSFVGNSARGRDEWGPFEPSENSGLGGALFNEGIANLVNDTFFANNARGGGGHFGSAPAMGGAIFTDGFLSLTNCTLAANTVISPAVNGIQGIELGVSLYVGTNEAVAKNSIFSASLGQTNIVGAILDAGHNISSDSAPVWTQSTSRSGIDPVLGKLGYYSGPTPTLALLAGSPAIDAAETLPDLAHDQRGRTRPFGSSSDIGAFESSPPYSIVGGIESQVPLGMVQITANGTVQSIQDANSFEIAGLPAGTYRIELSAPELVFEPMSRDLTIERDDAVDFFAYRLHAFTTHTTEAQLEIVFAGEANSRYRAQVSTNLSNPAAWTTLYEGTVPSQLLKMPEQTLTNDHAFFRVEMLGP